MNCSGFKLHFSAYIDGGLSDDIAVEVEKHLDNCPACAGLLGAYRTGIDVFRAGAEIEPPADMFDRVMAEVRGTAPRAQIVPLYPEKRRNVLAAAAVVSIAMIGSLLFTGGDRVEVSWNPAVDSTIDVVNADEIIPAPESESIAVRKPAQKAYLASYSGDEEPSFSYGVSNHPLIVESGVSAVAE